MTMRWWMNWINLAYPKTRATTRTKTRATSPSSSSSDNDYLLSNDYSLDDMPITE